MDKAYGAHNGYLPPYWNDSVDDEGLNHIFNYQHSSLRNVVERAFGVLKGKWRILKGVPRYERDKQAKIVVACFALHNYVLDRGDSLLHHDNQPYIQDCYPSIWAAPSMVGLRRWIAAGLNTKL